MSKDQMQNVKTFKKSIQEIQVVMEPREEFSATKIHSVGEASDLLRSLWPVPLNYREAFVSLNLNRANNTVSYALISIGGTSATVVDIKMIMQHALLSNASSIIIAHNHPSGNLEPSEQDIRTTKKIKSACEIMDISLLDHIILSEEPGDFYSFADNCLI